MSDESRELAELRREVEHLRKQNARLVAGLDAVERRIADASAPAAPLVQRRHALKVLGGVAAAGAGMAAAGFGGASPAHAVVGTPLVEGPNTPTTPYVVNAALSAPVIDITNTADGAALRLGDGSQDVLVVEGSTSLADVTAGKIRASGLSVDAPQDDVAITGRALNTGISGSAVQVGVEGIGLVGVRSVGSSVVSGAGVGLEASGAAANARFVPQGFVPYVRRFGPAQASAVYAGGELVVDSTGTWWACVSPGSTADSWRVIAAPESAGSFVAVVPIRFYDSRISGNRLAPNTERTVDLPATIPDDVRAVHINVTVTDTIGAGYLAVFPAGTPWSGTSTVNWRGDDQFVANAINVKTGGRRLTLRAGTNATNIVLDLYGYYR